MFFLLWIGACTAQKTPQSIPTATQEPSPTATQIPSPTPTLVPTARPLIPDEDLDGLYRDDLLGVALQYPPSWELLREEFPDGDQILLSNPDSTIFVLLSPTISYDDVPLEERFHEYTAFLPEELGFDAITWTIEASEYGLLDGPVGLRSLGDGEASASGDQLRFDILAVEDGNRTFWLTILSTPEIYEENKASLADIRNSLSVYSPRPYGVDRQNALFLPSGEPDTLDPALWLGGPDEQIGDLFSGLVQLDTNLQPIPDLAERWEVSSDGTTYTFYLRQNVTFHNGKAFTTQDVKYSWSRASNPELESHTAATYLGDILGVSEVIEGEAVEISGLHIIDDYTIEVTLDAPKAYFLSKLAYPTSWIVDEGTVDEIEESPNGTGPFKMIKYDENEVIILARNHNYHRGFVPLEYIVYLIYPGPSLRLYEAGEIDIISISEDLLERANDPADPLYGTVHANNGLCTFYVNFDVSKPPFDDPLVRRAFALAIDRERYNDVITEGKGVIAHGLYPPGLPGYTPDVRSLDFDPEAALDALRASSYADASNLPEIFFTISGSGGDISPNAGLLIQMWEETLGVKITVDQLDSLSFFDELYAGNFGHILSIGWCADYPDPENFADILFHTGSKQNQTQYSNPEIDALLEQARVERDIEKRFELYRLIEQRIVDDIPAIFLNHSQVFYTVVKPYLQGYVSTPIGVAQDMNLRMVRED